MIKASTIACAVLLAGCEQLPISVYDGYYFGKLDASCYVMELTQAHVWQGHVNLYMGQSFRYIEAIIHPDRHITGTGDWVDEQGPVHATFDGSFPWPIFGRGWFSGTVTDGRCNPHLSLYIPQAK